VKTIASLQIYWAGSVLVGRIDAQLLLYSQSALSAFLRARISSRLPPVGSLMAVPMTRI
jgi:hypothetical protein